MRERERSKGNCCLRNFISVLEEPAGIGCCRLNRQHQAEGKTTSAGKVTGSSELLFTGGKVISVH